MSEIDDLLAGIDTEVSNEPVKMKKAPIKKVAPSERSNSKFVGKLHLTLDTHYKFPEGYSEEILQLKEFMDTQGEKGVTFEEMFANVEKLYGTIEVPKLKNALYRINANNQISMKIIHKIVNSLNHEVTLKFSPTVSNDGMFDEGAIEFE